MYWPTPMPKLGSVCGIRFGHIVQISVQQVTKKCEALAIQWNILHACINTVLGYIILKKKKITLKKTTEIAHCTTSPTSVSSCINSKLSDHSEQREDQELTPGNL